MNKTPNTTIEFLHHLYSYISTVQGTSNETLRECIEKLFNASARLLEVVDAIEPYRDDVILALIEALNLPKNKTLSLHKNTLYVLKQIGDHNAVLLLMENFNDYVERFDFSFTRVLDAIAAREGEKTERLIVERYVDYLIYIDNFAKDRRWYKTSLNVIAVLSSLKKARYLNDPRLSNILEKYIEEIDLFGEDARNLSMFVLAKNDEKKALEIINDSAEPLPEAIIAAPQISRVVVNQIRDNANFAYITVSVKNQKSSPFEETSYLFEYEKPILLHLKRGTQEYQFATLVGREENIDEAARIAQQYIKKNLPTWQPPKNEFQECLNILTKHLNFESLGFQQIYIDPGKYPTIIYQSKLCKVRFNFTGSGQQHDHHTYLNVSYGRIHAPNNGSFLLVDKEERWSWHDDRFVLNFIDGLSPEESVKQKYASRIKDQYRETDLASSLQNLSPAEWTVGMVSYIWNEYDRRLFEVFSVENIDLWERYNLFVNEMYAIEKPDLYGLPPYNKIY